jgi:adenine-specific DNA-methyltransferase
MRADYGEVTREYFATATNTKVLVDFGMSQNFESATTYTNILLAQKSDPDSMIQMCRVRNDFNLSVPLTDYITLHAASIDNPGKDGWVAYNKDEYPIIKMVEQQGVQLTEKSWGIDINYGIKTGFNEAFIIPETIKNDLINADAKSSEIIKPLLRGEDVKPYVPVFAEQWLINSHNGIKEKSIPPINVERDYKAIFKWLKGHEVNLKKRQDKGDHWTNLRNCAYIEEFAKPKIIYPNMTKFLPFVYDETGYLTNQKCFIMTGEHLKYLTGVFNSKLWKFSFRNRFPELLGDTYELSKVFFEKIPIKKPESKLQEDVISNLVDYIITSKTEKAKLNEFVPNDHIAKQFGDVVDACVYELYFRQSVKEKDAEVIDWVNKDFTKIAGASKSDQLEAIRKGYQFLRDSGSEINQRITRQKLVPEIIVIQKSI